MKNRKLKPLHYVYREIIKEHCKKMRLEKFFNFVFPSSEIEYITENLAGKRIRGEMSLSEIEKNDYIESHEKENVLKSMDELISYLDNANEIIVKDIMLYVNDEQYAKDLRVCLDIYILNGNYRLFYYELFKGCVLGTIEEKKDKTDLQNFQEFQDLIIRPYGVSGTTAGIIITQMAENTENPYILYEAGEIEYKLGYTRGERTKLHIVKAYEYYKKASDKGFPLAYWSLGFMAQSGKADYITEFAVSKSDRMSLARYYFQKAADKKCVRAYNSLGNIQSKGANLFKDTGGNNSAEAYYELAAMQNDVYGMYNYGRILEKKIKKKVFEALEKDMELNEVCKEFENEINKMFFFIKSSADMGYPLACYRTALYYSEILFEDEKTIFPSNMKNPIVEYDNILAKKYFRMAIDLNKVLKKYSPIEKQAMSCLAIMEG